MSSNVESEMQFRVSNFFCPVCSTPGSEASDRCPGCGFVHVICRACGFAWQFEEEPDEWPALARARKRAAMVLEPDS